LHFPHFWLPRGVSVAELVVGRFPLYDFEKSFSFASYKMENTESERLATHKASTSFLQRSSLLKKEASGKKEQGSQVAEERQVKLQGQLRPLVPFFVPGEATSDGDLKINDSLRVPSKTSPEALHEPKEIIVRTWDRERGFFEEAVHRVTESSSELKPNEEASLGSGAKDQSAVEVRTKLLTPDSILARASAKKLVISPSPSGSHDRKDSQQKTSPDSSLDRDVCKELNFSEQTSNYRKGNKKGEQNRRQQEHKHLSQSSNNRQSGSPKKSPVESVRNSNKPKDMEKGKKGGQKDYRTPDKQNQKLSRKVKNVHDEKSNKNDTWSEADLTKRFAGSSYDTASPPPASLPLPSFVK